MIRDCSSKMDLSLLQTLERERVLEVLRRDKQLRIIEEDRIRWVMFDRFHRCFREILIIDPERRLARNRAHTGSPVIHRSKNIDCSSFNFGHFDNCLHLISRTTAPCFLFALRLLFPSVWEHKGTKEMNTIYNAFMIFIDLLTLLRCCCLYFEMKLF